MRPDLVTFPLPVVSGSATPVAFGTYPPFSAAPTDSLNAASKLLRPGVETDVRQRRVFQFLFGFLHAGNDNPSTRLGGVSSGPPTCS